MNTGEIVALVVSLISLVSTVIGVAMAFQKTKDRTDEAKRRIEELECRCDAYDKFAAKLAVIANDISWIRKSINGDNRRGADDRRDDRGTDAGDSTDG